MWFDLSLDHVVSVKLSDQKGVSLLGPLEVQICCEVTETLKQLS